MAFVLGGGGVLGAAEVGMLRALLVAGIRPDIVVGTSVGAINGVMVAADPTVAVTDRLARLWSSHEAREVYSDSVTRQVHRFASRSHLLSSAPLRQLLERTLDGTTDFADLAVPFRCCAASIERAAEHWFTTGPLVQAVLASTAVPGLLPPVRIGDEHFLDGGLVNSIPISEAVACGATTIWVLHVGRLERPLTVPRRAVEVAQVAFEVARRHRFARDVASLPDGIELHVLPTGGGRPGDDRAWAVPSLKDVRGRMFRAYTASQAYLATVASV